MDYIGCYVRPSLGAIRPEECVHPDDAEIFYTFTNIDSVYFCNALSDGYFVLSAGHLKFRVKPRKGVGFFIMPKPGKFYDDVVCVMRSKVGIAKGVISQVLWHSQREKVYYSLKFDNKMSSRWYWEEDFIVCASMGL